ncbi:uncharacterized protein LOC108909651 isoform X2 [Anoplophora glabripennis]|nr:uncharacterized protein LOC108909651 isoform X2 [Anoplophora glabripennis]
MGRSDPRPDRQKDPSDDDKIKDKYKTELIIRPRCKEVIKQAYNTTPVAKNSPKNQDKKKDDHTSDRRTDDSPQFEYIKKNLCIKTCIGNGEVLRFQVKKVTIRNYTPKILNQEINMGMWM